MRTKLIGSAQRNDGTSTRVVHLVLDGAAVVEVHSRGYHRSPYLPMDVANMEEALHLLIGDPCARKGYSDLTIN